MHPAAAGSDSHLCTLYFLSGLGTVAPSPILGSGSVLESSERTKSHLSILSHSSASNRTYAGL